MGFSKLFSENVRVNSILVLKALSDTTSQLKKQNEELQAELKALKAKIRENPTLTCNALMDRISSVENLKLHDKDVVANIVDSRTKPILDHLTAMDKVLKEALQKK